MPEMESRTVPEGAAAHGVGEGFRLELLVPGVRVRGLLPDRAVTVVQVEWHGTEAVTLTYRDEAGKVDHELLYRGSEGRLRLNAGETAWNFDADGRLF